MVLTFPVPKHYSWVLLTTVGIGWMTSWQTMVVVRHRKAAKIKYPQAYAEQSEVKASEAALKFNCAQRAHQNTAEGLTHFMFCMLFAGLHYPEVVTGVGVIWIVGRVLYTLGYITGNPGNRTKGMFSFAASVGLRVLATWTAGKLVLSTL